MGKKLVTYFEIVGEKAGVPGRMRLSLLTGITSRTAETKPDSPELLAEFYKAAKEILGPSAPQL